jgi:hypothetical protein
MDTPIPTLNGKLNSDLVNWVLEMKSSLESCNVDKDKIRKWSETNEEAQISSTPHK